MPDRMNFASTSFDATGLNRELERMAETIAAAFRPMAVSATDANAAFRALARAMDGVPAGVPKATRRKAKRRKAATPVARGRRAVSLEPL